MRQSLVFRHFNMAKRSISQAFCPREFEIPARLPICVWLILTHITQPTPFIVANRVRPRIAKRKEMPLAICDFEGTYSAKPFLVGHAGILCIVFATGMFLLTT